MTLESLLASQDSDGLLTEAPARLAAQLLAESAGQLDNASAALPDCELSPGRYKILDMLGVGGMGIVYLAEDPQLGRRVAIKLVEPQTSGSQSGSEGRARLLREAQALARVSHPNVIAVYDVGTCADQVFIAMEYVEGTTLSQWLTERKRTWREVVNVFIQAGRGLAAAHAAGIVHRDFKPDNVLVGNNGRVCVLDFGLARPAQPSNGEEPHSEDGQVSADATSMPRLPVLATTVTRQGKFIGTPAFMAPEQLMGERANEKTDQYSFCVALFQALYGAFPFDAEDFGALLEQMRQRRISKVPHLNSVPSSVHQALLRGLNPDPADRFSSLELLLDKLDQRPATPWRPTLIVAGLGMMLATGAGWGLSTKQGLDQDPSIAVLPFASLSTGEENAHFARGFHAELLRHLGRTLDLQVISRTSVLQYQEEGKRNLREIAEALGVSSIVEGSVQRSGNRVRVEATLIDARSDRQVWGDRYDREVADPFATQTALAEEIASALHAQLSAKKMQTARSLTENVSFREH